MSNYYDIYSSLRSPLHNPNFLPSGAEVLLRADLNVPMENKKIVDDFRLQSLIPTLDILLKSKAHIRLITHIDKPEGFDPNYSTLPIAAWIKEHGYPISHKKNSAGSITVEENVRFDPREQEPNIHYAQTLAYNSDYYINDAFGSAHRHDTSLTLLADQFNPKKRGIGLVMEKELQTLSTIRTNPTRPVVMVLGGGKIDKLKLAVPLAEYVDSLLLCPILGPVVSLFHLHEVQDEIQQLNHNQKVHLPVDYLVSNTYPWRAPFHTVPAHKLSGLPLAISIGPETIKAWRPLLEQAGTIIFNGPMGNITLPGTTLELHELLSIIANSKAYSVVGGGDSLQALDTYHLRESISYCSTGGGAMLTYLANERLPALDALMENQN
jgi:phosphoglycerate kinase